MIREPWSDIGRLQQEVSSIRQEAYQYAKNHEIFALSSKVDSLEHSLRDACSQIAWLRDELQNAQNKIMELEAVAGR